MLAWERGRMTQGHSRASRWRAGLISPAVLALSGCTGKAPTAGLEVTILNCDLRVGVDFDAIQAVVSQGTMTPSEPWQQRWGALQRVPQPISLPTTLAIRPGTSEDQDALIEVTALLNGQTVVQRVFETTIPTDHVDQRYVFLAADCVGKICPSEQTCEPKTATCVPFDLPPGTPDMCKYLDGGSSGAGTGASTGSRIGSAVSGRSAWFAGGVITGVSSGATAGWASGSTSTTGSESAGASSGAGAGSSGSSPAGLPDAGATASADAGAVAIPDAGVTVPRNCLPGGPGLDNCGPGGVGNESCCTSLEVEGGSFYQTYTSDADGVATGLADPASVSRFRLDKYDVTVGRFRQFANSILNGDGAAVLVAGSGKHTHLNGGNGLNGAVGGYEPGWVISDSESVAPTSANLTSCGSYSTWTPAVSTQENLPINCVNWYEAYAFCIWDGGFLPTEAEWGFAAAGGNQEREYPWGSAAPGPGNQYANYGCNLNYSIACVDGSAGRANITPVGTAALGLGLFGQFDLVGNLWQKTLDWDNGRVSDCIDCANLTATSSRVQRGSSFESNALPMGSQYSRDSFPPDTRQEWAGIRCARSP
jgi:formylglycine-generating enzyme required for sulfatase activity